MTDVTMIGLGAMGGALARAFLGAGHAVTVWNRTASKADAFLELGAIGALQRIRNQAKLARINSEVPDLISSFFRRAIAAGYGKEDVASVIKVMRSGNTARHSNRQCPA